MANVPSKKRGTFEALWPMPGVALLALLAVWLVYMGSIAELDDVRTAFYGLGGVTVLIILLGLRKMNESNSPSDSDRTFASMRDRRRARKAAERGETLESAPKRSAIPDEALDEPPRERPADAVMPQNRRMRARAGSGAGAGAQTTGPVSALDSEEQETSLAAPAELAPDKSDEMPLPPSAPRRTAAEEPAAPAAAAPALPQREATARAPQADEGDTGGSVADRIDRLEAMLTREKAERGAQVARLEAARADAGEGAPQGGLQETLRPYLSIAAFNNAMTQKVFPRIEKMIEKAVDTAMTPQALRTRLGFSTPDGDEPVGSEQLAILVAELRQQVEAREEEAVAERKAIREDVDEAKRLADKAARALNKATREGGALDQERLTKLLTEHEGMDAEVGKLRETVDTLQDRLFAANGVISELRDNASRLGAQIAGSQETYKTLLDKVDRINAATPPEAAGSEVASEVDALRDALTTIIEQNRDIRAQQEALSARLDPAASSDGPRET